MRTLAILLLIAAPAVAGDLADTLKKMPHVKSVKTRVAKGETTIIHILDWHIVPLDAFAVDVGTKDLAKRYAEHVTNVTKVQAEQVELLSAMLKLDVAGVFVEGLTKEDMPVFKIISRVVARKKKAGDIEGLYQTILQHGAAGKLYRQGKLKEILPLDDEAAMKAANPVKNGKVKIDKAANEKREDAMVRNLLTKKGIVVVILGGAHDLRDNLKRAGAKVEYVRVETEAYSRIVGGR